MKIALLKKELRENLGLALCVLLLFSFWDGAAIGKFIEKFSPFLYYMLDFNNDRDFISPFLTYGFGGAIFFLCICSALLMGYMAGKRERSRGSWPFLLAQPLPLPTLLFYKLLALISLYTLAFFIPLFIRAWWASIEGHYASPWTWWLLVPSVLSFLFSLPCLLASFWTGFVPGRWWGLKSFPLLTAVFTAGIMKTLPLCFLEGILLLGFLFFLSMGMYGKLLLDHFSRRRSPCLDWLRYSAMLLICTVAVALIPKTPEAEIEFRYSREGELVKREITAWASTVYNMQGERIGEYRQSWDDPNGEGSHMRNPFFQEKEERSFFGKFLTLPWNIDKVWFWEEKYSQNMFWLPRQKKFLIYGEKEKRLLYIWDKEGMKEANKPFLSFDPSMRYRYDGEWFYSDKGLFFMDTEKNLTRQIFDLPLLAIERYTDTLDEKTNLEANYLFAIAKESKKIWVLDANKTELLASFSLPDIKEEQLFLRYIPSKRALAIVANVKVTPSYLEQKEHVCKAMLIDEAGNILHQAEPEIPFDPSFFSIYKTEIATALLAPFFELPRLYQPLDDDQSIELRIWRFKQVWPLFLFTSLFYLSLGWIFFRPTDSKFIRSLYFIFLLGFGPMAVVVCWLKKREGNRIDIL